LRAHALPSVWHAIATNNVPALEEFPLPITRHAPSSGAGAALKRNQASERQTAATQYRLSKTPIRCAAAGNSSSPSSWTDGSGRDSVCLAVGKHLHTFSPWTDAEGADEGNTYRTRTTSLTPP